MTARTTFCWAFAALFVVAPASNAGEEFDWNVWRKMVVFDSGRIKPFDTAARETILNLTGKVYYKPTEFETISTVDVFDWPGVAKLLAAPGKDADPKEVVSQDGRSDRFKSGEAGSATPITRIRDLLTPETRRRLRDADFASDAELTKALEKLEETLVRLKTRVFERDGERRSLAELRAEIVKTKHTEGLAVLKEYDEKFAKWLPVNDAKARLMIELNALLGFAQLFNKQFWLSDKLPDEAQKLVDEGPLKLPPQKLARLNRYLMSSALGTKIADVPPPTTKGPSGERAYDPVELYLTLLFTWQGWDPVNQATTRQAVGESLGREYNDGWSRVPMILAGHVDLAPILQPESKHHATLVTINGNRHFKTWLGRMDEEVSAVREQMRAERDVENRMEKFDQVERKGMDAYETGVTLRAIRSGLHLQVGAPLENPTEREDANRWKPILLLVGAADPMGPPYDASSQLKLRTLFMKARKAFLADKAVEFNEASAEFTSLLHKVNSVYAARLAKEADELTKSMRDAKESPSGLNIFDWLDDGKRWDPYPTEKNIALEIFYNRFDPFGKTWVIAFVAALVLAVSMGFQNPLLYRIGFLGLLGAIGMTIYGVYLRVVIAGRAPVTNMFETLIWASLVASVVGTVIGGVYRSKQVHMCAAVLLALSNLIATNLPVGMGSSISPLMPVLRSQKWLIIHVMTIVASYGAFMLSWLLGNVGLWSFIIGTNKPAETKATTQFAYRSMQVGVLLLFVGTLLGGWWAADSWGRFWGWDAKEVWALIALLTYIIILHARFAGMKTFGTLVSASLGFTMVVGSWYGVNFLFPAGLHAYAFNSGGQWYVIGSVLANIGYVSLAIVMKQLRSRTPMPETVTLA